MKPTPFKSETAKARAKGLNPDERAYIFIWRYHTSDRQRKQDTDAD